MLSLNVSFRLYYWKYYFLFVIPKKWQVILSRFQRNTNITGIQLTKWKFEYLVKFFGNPKSRPQRICYSHWANRAQNGVISIGQWGVFNHEKGAIWQTHLAAQKEGVVTPLSFLITKPINLDLSNLHYGPHYKPHYRTQGCVIKENNITISLRTPLRTPLRTL